MNDPIEIEGKTIDDAIEKACKEFNLPREKLNIEILSQGTSGFLGLVGSKKALIRASVMSIDITIDGVEEETKRDPAAPPEESAPETFDDPTISKEAQEMLEGILSRMGIDFPVNAAREDEYVVLDIKGDGSGLLIGRGGQTLDALQYIVNKALNKNGRDRKRIILDTENYRKKKEKNLIALAEKLGAKAKRMRKSVTVSPMNAHDRRIIHLALQNDKGLTTKSRGEGAFRKIIIVPTKKGK
ncbi:MAG: protein jag [Deltaproteobacteria bacterium]|nr:protein jag [Deltaproteobacteria bacterium]